MLARAAALSVVVAALAACGSAQGASTPADPAATATAPGPPKRPLGAPDDDLVRLYLLADVTRVAPDQELTLAARLDIAPGWHVYWQNPGESGLATDAVFTAPAGFAVGPVRYPGPVEFDSPGEIVSFGYHDLAVLSARVTAPATLGAAVRFSVKASWLACRDVCVRGEAAAAIDLPPASASEPSQPAHPELFARHDAELPRPWGELRGARARWQRDDKQVRLAIEVDGAERVEYFPPAGEDLALTGRASIPAPEGGGAARVELSYKPSVPAGHASGVLAVASAGETRYYALDLQEDGR